VWNARVREDVRVSFTAPDLTKGLDLLAVLLRFIVLLAILMQAMVSIHGRPFGRLPDRSAFLNLFHESTMRLLSVLPLCVLLWARRALFSFSHRVRLS
jgi:hypothetical protein